ncbi:hypothetical protein Tco_1082964 [Tanacetum coccineum]|uniref:Uncharacterized protein n=1 Tax=Tanacetum coccineum TaxID=301880 RepID=A0ABQ5I1Z4_9ASTR
MTLCETILSRLLFARYYKDGFFEISAQLITSRDGPNGILLMELLLLRKFLYTTMAILVHTLLHSQYYEEQSPVHHHFSPSQAQAPSHMPTDDLLQTVPKLISSNRFNLESVLKQTKLTMGNAINSEDEEPEAHASGEEQEEEISPNTLEAAKTLSKVASLKSRSIDKGRRYKRRKESTGKKVVSSLDFQEDNTGAEKVNAASIEVNTASDVNTGSIELNTVIEQDSNDVKIMDKEKGKLLLLSEETPRKTKERFQEEASLAEAIKIGFPYIREEEDEQIICVIKEPCLEVNFKERLAKKNESNVMEVKSAEEGELLKKSKRSISRDDLTELYRIVMNRYGLDGPEDKLEKGFWKCLRIMFEEPLSTDSIWSEIEQQKIVSWRYYDTSRVHCLNLESMDVYLLSDRKYPLPAEQEEVEKDNIGEGDYA